MKRIVKYGGPAILVLVAVIAGRSAGRGPGETPRPPAVAAAAVSTATACPVSVIQTFETFTVYYAHICNPDYAGMTMISAANGLTLGPCGQNPDCVPYELAAERPAIVDDSIFCGGLPRLADPAAMPRSSEGADVLDTMLVDLIPDSETPTVPRRIKLFLTRYVSQTPGDRETRMIGVGVEVRRDESLPAAMILPQDRVERVGPKAGVLRLGDVRYQILLHAGSPSL